MRPPKYWALRRHNTFLLLDGHGLQAAAAPNDEGMPTVGHAALVCECVHQLVVVQVDGTGAHDELVDLAFVVTLVLHAVIHPRLDIGGVDGEIIG